MKARDIMSRVKAPKRSASSRDVAMRLLSEETTSLPVVDDEGMVVGIVSELDILGALRTGKDLEELPVSEIMSFNPYCVDEETPVEKMIDVMTEKHIIRLPVVRGGRLVGTVSRRNIMDSMVYHGYKESFWVLRDSD